MGDYSEKQREYCKLCVRYSGQTSQEVGGSMRELDPSQEEAKTVARSECQRAEIQAWRAGLDAATHINE